MAEPGPDVRRMNRVDYDQVSAVYDRRYQAGGPAGIAESLRGLAGQTQGRRMLEVGCGTGHWLARLPAGGIRCGLDCSARMLDKARERDSSLDLVLGTAGRLPFGRGAFDFVFCVHALHHFDDPAAFIRQARWAWSQYRGSGTHFLTSRGLPSSCMVSRWIL